MCYHKKLIFYQKLPEGVGVEKYLDMYIVYTHYLLSIIGSGSVLGGSVTEGSLILIPRFLLEISAKNSPNLIGSWHTWRKRLLFLHKVLEELFFFPLDHIVLLMYQLDYLKSLLLQLGILGSNEPLLLEIFVSKVTLLIGCLASKKPLFVSLLKQSLLVLGWWIESKKPLLVLALRLYSITRALLRVSSSTISSLHCSSGSTVVFSFSYLSLTFSTSKSNVLGLSLFKVSLMGKLVVDSMISLFSIVGDFEFESNSKPDFVLSSILST
ncbi:hypothetical protein AGLY_015389 [Aphis glycines]|uniref:Uncharacterized protein n=1 Tax=Aphis glycines TaxID=307491 RepID=A0A6G0T127_APHGL|nr:hypothetical protein AGLY_015389 [Aphis glycines]